MSVPAPLRRAIVERAGGRCEYCGIAQAGQEARFHVDHVLPAARGGRTDFENLAVACVSCSLRKGARRQALDPLTQKPTPLFHPRRQRWSDHFHWAGCRVLGRTSTGRATIEALRMNRLLALEIRSEERLLGRHPPPGHVQ